MTGEDAGSIWVVAARCESRCMVPRGVCGEVWSPHSNTHLSMERPLPPPHINRTGNQPTGDLIISLREANGPVKMQMCEHTKTFKWGRRRFGTQPLHFKLAFFKPYPQDRGEIKGGKSSLWKCAVRYYGVMVQTDLSCWWGSRHVE